jgi:hypothetical protein
MLTPDAVFALQAIDNTSRPSKAAGVMADWARRSDPADERQRCRHRRIVPLMPVCGENIFVAVVS